MSSRLSVAHGEIFDLRIDLRMRFLGQAKRQSRALDYARDDREEGMLEMTGRMEARNDNESFNH